jgi:uncharacterized protein YerC
MKDHRILSPRQEVAAEDELYRAVLSLKDLGECRAFFLTGVSLTTISRVARYMSAGAGGYSKVLERFKK